MTSTRRIVFPRRGVLFFREFLRSPLRTASVVPSSRALAAAMIPDDPFDMVVELGPGTGALTEALQGRDRVGSHLALELNPVLAAGLAADYPAVEVVTAAAGELEAVASQRELVGEVDLIVSGLPWQAFAGTVGSQLIPAIARTLRPGGVFTQFTYCWTRWAPPGRRQEEQLREHFAEVRVSSPVWRNLPPATVYTCRTSAQRG